MSESKSEKIAGYDVHPQAAKFPLLEGAEFDELVVSVKANGLKKRIKLTSLGVLVDGRNRLRACIKAGIDPQFEQLPEGTDVLQVIVQENILRRHLTVSQRAMFAAELVTAGTGRPSGGTDRVSSAEAGKKLSVSKSTVDHAKSVIAKGAPEVVAAVKSGEIDVKPAAKIVDLPKEDQPAAVEQHKADKGKPRQKSTDASFKRDKWRAKAETALSKLVAEAPADLHDWARGALRDCTGGSLRREAKLNVPEGDEVALYDESDVISRIECMLKEIPAGERKTIGQAIGCYFIGKKPEHYLPAFVAEDGEAEKIGGVIAELRHRLKQLEEIPEAAKVLKRAALELKKLTKAEDAE